MLIESGMKSILVLTALIVKYDAVFGIKVRERFKYLPEHNAVFGLPCMNAKLEDVMSLNIGGLSINYALQLQKNINVTTICMKGLKPGTRDANGTYDGMIGLVQSNVVNTVMQVFPYDFIFDEPGVMLPAPMTSFTPHIYSAKIHGQNNSGLDVLYLFTNFNLTIWFFWLTILTLCSILCQIMKFTLEQHSTITSLIGQFIESFWNYFMLLVDMAPSSASALASAFALWTTICIAVYYGIHMVFMTTLSADLSVPGADNWVDNLGDLLDEEMYRKYRPTILTQLNMMNALSSSLNGSLERRLLDRALATNFVMTFEPKVEALGSGLIELVKDTGNGTRAVIEDQFFVDVLIAEGMCAVQADYAINFVKSKEPVYNLPIGMLLSHSTHPLVRRLFTYRSRTAAELGIIEGTQRVVVPFALQYVGVSPGPQSFICTQTVKGFIPKDSGLEWSPLPFFFFKRFFLICLSLVIVALIVHFYEIMFHFALQSVTRRKRRVRVAPVPIKSNVVGTNAKHNRTTAARK